MHEIYTEIIINATPEIVWSILTDLSSYKDWNPFILESVGQPVVGDKLTCRPRLPGSKRILNFHPTVTRVMPCREFAWKGHVLFPGLADGEHIFEIHPLEGDGILHVHRQEFKGLLIPFIPQKTKRSTALGFEMMNKALKIRAEKMAGQ
ncbi:MAG: SRPBCC domain-containing protein [Desulfatibacillum sp.]|nr:SRPBCC domain-containing protein [Desulfatibacillum sp.]